MHAKTSSVISKHQLTRQVLSFRYVSPLFKSVQNTVADLVTTAAEISRADNMNMSDHYFDLMRRMVKADMNSRIDVETALEHPLFENIRDRFTSAEDAWRVGDDVAPHEELQESIDARRFNTKYDIYNSDMYNKEMTRPVRFSL